MATPEIWTPPGAANKIVKVVEAVSRIHGLNRFPLDVPTVALEVAKIFGWPDPISKVQAANIKGFEGRCSRMIVAVNGSYFTTPQ